MKAFKSVLSVILSLAIVAGIFGCYGVFASAADNQLGDANSDGAINSFDALMILRYATDSEELTAKEIKAADVDGNGIINSADALYVLHFACGKITTFPASEEVESKLVKIIGNFSYDPATGRVTNPDGSGLLGFSYDANENVFYASLNAWQRNFGYTYIYDYAAPFGVIWYDTSRVFFNYDNKEWMVQLWKGQYGWVLIGCEIGLYYRDFDDHSFLVDDKDRKYFKCADDDMLIKMSLSLYRDGKLLFSRKQQYSWWLTGFVPGMLDNWGFTFDSPQSLTGDSKLTFTDEAMMDAFIEGLKKTTIVEHNATKLTRDIKFEYGKNYTVNRATNSVSFTWN